jgi:hypothetical protein
MPRFVCKFTGGSTESDYYEEVFPVEHSAGPEGFRIALFEEAHHHWLLYMDAVSNKIQPIFLHAHFEFMRREWETTTLIDKNGNWLEHNIECFTIDEWFDAEGLIET